MGEITDALRRAQESRSADPDAGEPRRQASSVGEALRQAEQARREQGPPQPSPAPDPRPSRPPKWAGPGSQGPPGQTIQELEPTSPAIAFHGSPTVEACRRVAVRVKEHAERRGVRSLAIVSGLRAEGKTTVLCNLGLSMATLSQGRAVALVDLDLRKPSLARVLGIDARLGMEDVLTGRATLGEVRVAVERPALDLYPAAAPQTSAHELLVTPRLGATIRELEQRYDLVLIDTPPALVVPDVSIMLRHVGACILIARCGVTRTRSFASLVEALPRDQILGELLNESQLAPYAYQYGTDPEVEQAGAAPPRKRRRRQNP